MTSFKAFWMQEIEIPQWHTNLPCLALTVKKAILGIQFFKVKKKPLTEVFVEHCFLADWASVVLTSFSFFGVNSSGKGSPLRL